MCAARAHADEKLKYAEKYRERLEAQLLDGKVLYLLKSVSRRARSDILTLMVDLMDKSKFPLPNFEEK